MAKKRRTRKRTAKRKTVRRKSKLTSCASKMGRKGGTVTKALKKGIFSAAHRKKVRAAKKTARKLTKQLAMFG
jgi:hypothetical protein